MGLFGDLMGIGLQQLLQVLLELSVLGKIKKYF